MSYFNRFHAQRSYTVPVAWIDATHITPGELAQREGADQEPSPIIDDETARRVRALLDLHANREP